MFWGYAFGALLAPHQPLPRQSPVFQTIPEAVLTGCWTAPPALWHEGAHADVAKPVDAADFDWSAREEIRDVEPPKFGER